MVDIAAAEGKQFGPWSDQEQMMMTSEWFEQAMKPSATEGQWNKLLDVITEFEDSYILSLGQLLSLRQSMSRAICISATNEFTGHGIYQKINCHLGCPEAPHQPPICSREGGSTSKKQAYSRDANWPECRRELAVDLDGAKFSFTQAADQALRDITNNHRKDYRLAKHEVKECVHIATGDLVKQYTLHVKAHIKNILTTVTSTLVQHYLVADILPKNHRFDWVTMLDNSLTRFKRREGDPKAESGIPVYVSLPFHLTHFTHKFSHLVCL